ncbi:MAG: four helix bundle protein [Gemmatimonadetes bacterium]|nr:four helix bundle protein [Gemmatimonadota bacterium]
MRAARFEDLEVWRRAKDLAVSIYQVTNAGAFARDFGLRDQIRRAAESAMSNIAEGFERYSAAEFQRFLSISRASAGEVRSQLHLARELGYVSEPESSRLISAYTELGRMIAALRATTGPQ